MSKSFRILVPGGGVEPPWSCLRRILSPLRLPVPPSRLICVTPASHCSYTQSLRSSWHAHTRRPPSVSHGSQPVARLAWLDSRQGSSRRALISIQIS